MAVLKLLLTTIMQPFFKPFSRLRYVYPNWFEQFHTVFFLKLSETGIYAKQKGVVPEKSSILDAKKKISIESRYPLSLISTYGVISVLLGW